MTLPLRRGRTPRSTRRPTDALPERRRPARTAPGMLTEQPDRPRARRPGAAAAADRARPAAARGAGPPRRRCSSCRGAAVRRRWWRRTPGSARLVLLLLVWVLRSGSLAASAAGDRRRVRGRKWYDGAQFLLRTPWDLLRSLPGTLMLVLWSAGLAVAAALLCYAFVGRRDASRCSSAARCSRRRCGPARAARGCARRWPGWSTRCRGGGSRGSRVTFVLLVLATGARAARPSRAARRGRPARTVRSADRPRTLTDVRGRMAA